MDRQLPMKTFAARVLERLPGMNTDFGRRTCMRLDGRTEELRRELEESCRRKQKLRKSDQPIVDGLRAALGLPLQALPEEPLSAKAAKRAPPKPKLERITRAPGRSDLPHIWIVIPAGIQYFRFVESGALAAIENEYRVTWVFPHHASPQRLPQALDELKHDDIIFVPVDARRYSVWGLLFQVSCAALARRSTSFRIRHEMAQASRDHRATTFLRKFIRRMVPVFASRPLFGTFRRNVIKALGADPVLAGAMAEDCPAAVLLPSSLLDSLTNDVIAASRYLGIPCIALQTSWDNLSSKGIVAMPPDMMGVWGEQSVKHAVELQDMARKGCVIVGSPYYEPFFHGPRRSKRAAREVLGFPLEGIVALYGGSFRQFDEAGLLRRIEEAIDAGHLPMMTIFYRPHPLRLPRKEESFFEFDWKYSIMDKEIEPLYRANLEGKESRRDEYDIERLAEIYTAVDLTISPMSSIVLESLLFGLPVLGIGYGDGKNVWGPDKTSQMTHFRELHDLPCVRISKSPAKTVDDLKTVVGWAARPETAQSAREAARYFVDNRGRRYAQNVLGVLSSAVGRGTKRAH